MDQIYGGSSFYQVNGTYIGGGGENLQETQHLLTQVVVVEVDTQMEV